MRYFSDKEADLTVLVSFVTKLNGMYNAQNVS